MTDIDLIKWFKQIKYQWCTPISELSSDISTLILPGIGNSRVYYFGVSNIKIILVWLSKTCRFVHKAELTWNDTMSKLNNGMWIFLPFLPIFNTFISIIFVFELLLSFIGNFPTTCLLVYSTFLSVPLFPYLTIAFPLWHFVLIFIIWIVCSWTWTCLRTGRAPGTVGSSQSPRSRCPTGPETGSPSVGHNFFIKQ